MVACPSCRAGNAQTAKFCGSCGAAINAGAQAGPAPPPPQPPPYPPNNSRFNVGGMGAMGGACDIQSIAPMDPLEAFAHVEQTLMAYGGRAMMQNPPSSMQIELPYKDIWLTGGMTVRFRGLMTFTPQGPKQTLLQSKLAIDWGSAALVPIFVLVAAAFAGFMNPLFFMMYLIFGALCAGIAAWMLSTTGQAKAAAKFVGALSGAQPEVARPKFTMPKVEMPGMSGGGHPGWTPPPQGGASADPAPMEQLERLAKLRDAGVVTAAEFEAKKAEILKRL
ncbi:MAG: hypothetical protein FD124_248 [Alphaproteobacteria bacterium]|nr:MAG: hypothetical protein FD160_950 [Caulobacteraceae bacterium]TPW08626.1 MAG: hypothetical protein FD124_248 [Alphaproteobacteria bacterium]